MFSRFEHGSTFYWPDIIDFQDGFDFIPSATLFGSGRIALWNLLEFGYSLRGWRRMWVPTYYCEDVITSMRDSRVSIVRYPCGPLDEGVIPIREEGDVLLRLDYFGWGLKPLVGFWDGEIIEDRTHDPFVNVKSSADFVIASLRKTIPLPDGGICWSPRGHLLPQKPSTNLDHECAVLERLAGMALKRHYLLGGNLLKETYRELDVSAEQAFLKCISAPMSGISGLMLHHFPLGASRAARGMNFAAFREAISGDPLLNIHGPVFQEAPAVAVVSINKAKLRDELRSRLAKQGIYTAVLWPVPETGASWHTESDAKFASSTLMVHVDFRYRPDDMKQVADKIRRLAREIHGEKK